VILRTGGDEAWLAGALVLSDDAPVAILFIAPDAGGDRAILVRPRPASELIWLEAIDGDALARLGLGGEPPSAIELDRQWFSRVRRLPLRVAREGAGAPDVGAEIVLAEYAAGGAERVVAIVGPGVARAWRGAELPEGLYEVIPSGASTLDT